MSTVAIRLPQSASGAALLWLDYTDYAAKLLAGGSVPWLDPAELVAWHRKAQGLLRGDVVTLPLAALASARAQADAALLATMREKPRVTHPLRVLLGDEALRQRALAALQGLRAQFPNQTLALWLPSPARWLEDVWALAHADAPAAIDEDAIDAAAVLVADLLRAFAASGIDTVVLDEGGHAPPPEAVELYAPILNVAAHYQWQCGWRADVAAAAPFDFGVGQHGDVQELDWNAPAAEGRARYLRIPADAVPEQVLSVLDALR